ncbi:MAG TPA: metal-dependent hydrolase, partial [Rudaea sp.]
KQGYKIRGFQRRVDYFLYRIVERITPLKLRLSMVSCVEHVNAYIGHEFLAQQILHDADAKTRALFEWHFAEEIEHKNVAFDVLQTVAPSYLLRLLGALLVLPLFYLLMSVGTFNFLWQEKALRRRSTWRLLREHLFGKHHMVRRTLGHIANYLRPGFHPSQLDDDALARDVLDRYSAPRAALLQSMDRAA